MLFVRSIKFSSKSVMLQINSSTSPIVNRAFRLENRFYSPLSVSRIKLDKWKTILKVIISVY